MTAQQLVQQLFRHVDVFSQDVRRMAAQEESIEQRRLTLRSQRIDLFHELNHHKNSSINVLATGRNRQVVFSRATSRTVATQTRKYTFYQAFPAGMTTLL